MVDTGITNTPVQMALSPNHYRIAIRYWDNKNGLSSFVYNLTDNSKQILKFDIEPNIHHSISSWFDEQTLISSHTNTPLSIHDSKNSKICKTNVVLSATNCDESFNLSSLPLLTRYKDNTFYFSSVDKKIRNRKNNKTEILVENAFSIRNLLWDVDKNRIAYLKIDDNQINLYVLESNETRSVASFSLSYLAGFVPQFFDDKFLFTSSYKIDTSIHY